MGKVLLEVCRGSADGVIQAYRVVDRDYISGVAGRLKQ